MNYAELYNDLYKIGYHYKSADRVQDWGKLLCIAFGVGSAVDLGCGEGRGVRELLDLGVDAYGCDVSSVAVEKARVLTAEHRIVECSITKTPFEDGAFEAVFCADTLEHLVPEDVPAALDEIHRVTSHYVFLYPYPEPERNRRWLDQMHKQNKYMELENLHLTIKPLYWWEEQCGLHGILVQDVKHGWIIGERL